MSDAALHALAAAAGLVIDWEDAAGQPQTVTPDSLRAILGAMGLACATPGQCADSARALAAGRDADFLTADAGAAIAVPGLAGSARLTLESGEVRDLRGLAGQLPAIATAGYHRLESGDRAWTIAVAPPRGCAVTDAAAGRPWGTSVQIYALRGTRPSGFGDFAALANCARVAGGAGAAALAISPVHALFTADPGRYSPYSPSSRRFLNPLFADPGAADGAPDAALIDWHAAAPARLAALRRRFDRHDPADAARTAAFAAREGEDLRRHALFEALHGHFFAQTGAQGWQGWPAAYQDPAGAAAAGFVRDHADAIAFHIFLQALADHGLADAQAAARAAGMAIGLVADLAVGLDRGGSHAWSRPDDLLAGLGIGAPPDAFQAAGQNWGITSFSPQALRRTGFAPFLAMLRSAMRHAGGVRIDHALGLRRLWVVPEGASSLDGAYLRYPETDLLRLVALESQRAQAIVIGEDLGVVPPGFRDAIAARGLLGMRVLPFERDAGGFVPPARWDPAAVAMTSTHDLPPIAGWWRGCDIDWRERLAMPGDRAAERVERAADRTQLWDACIAAGVARGPVPSAEITAPAVDAGIAFTAESPCDLLIVPIEDLLGLDEAPNLPGTIDHHPNWRRRLPDRSERLFARSEVAVRVARLTTGTA